MDETMNILHLAVGWGDVGIPTSLIKHLTGVKLEFVPHSNLGAQNSWPSPPEFIQAFAGIAPIKMHPCYQTTVDGF